MTASPYSVASWLSRGEDCLAQGDYAQALVAFEQAIAMAQEQPNRSALYACHRQLATTYKLLHRFELALHHLETATSLRDGLCPSLFSNSESEAGSTSLSNSNTSDAPGQDDLPRLFRSIVEQANLGVAIFQQGHLIYGNAQFKRWVGYNDLELWPLTLSELVILPPGQERNALGLTAAAPAVGQIHDRSGQTIDVEIYATTIDYVNRPVLVTFLRDITEAQRLEDQLKASEARYRSLIHHVPIGLCRFSVEGRPLDANPALLAIFGFDTLANFLQASPIQPDSPVTDQGHPMTWGSYLGMTSSLKDCELKLSRPDGRDLWVRVVARAIRESIPTSIADHHGTTQYYEAAVEDITAIKAAQTALEELAMRDSLTHVYNRRHFMELASREIARSARFNRPVTLIMLDVDHFKSINDTYGHLAGDTVLRDIALRLRANLRQSDILARYGGEEFILLMPETDQAQAWTGAERLRTVIAATPFDSGSGPLSVTASVGLSCWPASPDPSTITSLPHINDLISKADQALYRAKQSGRNQTQAEAWLCTIGSQIA
jgi:diguanylate cyclase (GGDEF)-like protein/PAS domain S-box-containing protein